MKKRKMQLQRVLLFLFALTLLCIARPAFASESGVGKWVTKNSHQMYRKADGTYARNTWFTIEGKKYLFDKNGYALFGMRTWKGNKYYIRKRSGMATGWLTYKNATYYFLKNGKMVRKKWKTIDGKKYYFGTNGKMATGWLKLGSKTYYLGQDGARVTGEQQIGGKSYYFSKQGVYDPDPEDSIDPGKPMVALTYDDGPGKYTDRLLNYLEKNDAVATFFLVGQNISSYKSTVRRAYKLGCEIGSHTWDHAYLTKLSASQLASELSKTNAKIKTITGKNATLVRPPYGAYNKTVLANLNAPAITWSIDTRDWEHRNASKTISNVMNNVKDGDIILMHDIHKQTVDAAKELIPKLKKAGYQLVTVSQLAKYKNVTLKNGKVYSSIR